MYNFKTVSDHFKIKDYHFEIINVHWVKPDRDGIFMKLSH